MPFRFIAAGLFSLNLISGDAHASQASALESGPVYLAYAGPYSSSPSSAFGHLFLVVSSDPDEAPPLWDVITFSAETFGADPVRYLSVGIAGGFLGRYIRADFHEKARDYELLEDRDLWLVELNFSSAQRRALEAELAATEGRWYPYTFFKKNCAHYLQILLARATGAIDVPAGVVSPTGVVEALLNSELAGATYFRPAISRRLEALRRFADRDVASRLRREPWTDVAADTAWLRDLSERDRGFVQEFFSLRTLHQRSALDESTLRGLALLRVLNARPGDRAAMNAPRGPGQRIAPPAFHGYSRLRFTFSGERQGDSRIALAYRAAAHDVADSWLAHRPINVLEFLAIEVSTPATELAPRLESAVLFSQRSLSPSDWISSRTSWMIEALGRRGGVFDNDALHWDVRIGVGKSYRLPSRTVVYGLITGAVTSRCCDDLAFAPGVEAGFLSLPADRLRYGLRYAREHDVSDWNRHHERLRAWVRYDTGLAWGIMASADAGSRADRFGLSIDWYP